MNIGAYSSKPNANLFRKEEISRGYACCRFGSKTFSDAILSLDTFRNSCQALESGGAALINDISAGI
jgi:dihydropteroate synthase